MNHTIRLIHIRPRVLSPHDILHFFPLHITPLINPLVDQKLVGTCATFQAILTARVFIVAGAEGDGQAVGAAGANYICQLLREALNDCPFLQRSIVRYQVQDAKLVMEIWISHSMF